jgi:hypothetical protein
MKKGLQIVAKNVLSDLFFESATDIPLVFVYPCNVRKAPYTLSVKLSDFSV